MTELRPRPNLAWNLADLPAPGPGAPEMVTTFACGGGSSMGYKRAGFKVRVANDIDPAMVRQYRLNFPETDVIEAPIGDLSKDPEFVRKHYGVDLLDGSPPCTLFSVGNSAREEWWGREKHFREGQNKQILDRLFIDYLDLVEELQPKTFIAENVGGMLQGNSKGYTREVLTLSRALGYEVDVVRAYALWYGVPQRRERVFFVGRRADLPNACERFVLPSPAEINTVGDAFAGLPLGEDEAVDKGPGSFYRKWHLYDEGHGERTFAGFKVDGKMSHRSFFVRLGWQDIAPTVTTNTNIGHPVKCRNITPAELKRLTSFADDYQFTNPTAHTYAKYLVGMSVPPFLMEAVAAQVREMYLT